MSLKEILSKASHPLQIADTLNTTNDAISSLKDQKSGALETAVKTSAAVYGISQLLPPEYRLPVTATAFAGAFAYKVLNKDTQETVSDAMQKDGLTPTGKPISGGYLNQAQQMFLKQRATARA